MGKISLIFALFLLSSFQPEAPKPFGVTKVVIDAGHGGHDPGCLGKKSKEKDVALGIALKLGKKIEENFPDVSVIYTRKTDVFVELYERANIANNARADLFICIHCNSACYFDKKKKKEICNTVTSGVESWVMGLNKTDENLEVAKRENEVILLEKDYTKQYNGFDPNSPEANIIFSLYQNTYLDKSLKMASFVQEEMKARGRGERGVKQAGFLVLYKTSMPSILIETGFLSNPLEEKFLSSEKGQDELAYSIYKAFKHYKASVEAAKVEIDRPDSGNQKKEPEPKPDSSSKESKESDKKVQATNHQKPEENTKPVEAPKTKPATSGDEVLQWSVQFYTSPKPIADNHKIYNSFEEVKEDFHAGLYKYSTGLLATKQEAMKLQTKIRQMGYKDAFIVVFLNNKRITIREANEWERNHVQ